MRRRESADSEYRGIKIDTDHTTAESALPAGQHAAVRDARLGGALVGPAGSRCTRAEGDLHYSLVHPGKKGTRATSSRLSHGLPTHQLFKFVLRQRS